MKPKLFRWLDRVFRETDRTHIRRTKNIRLIPAYHDRRGGKLSYAEWAHVIGIFQTLLYQELEKKTGANILEYWMRHRFAGYLIRAFCWRRRQLYRDRRNESRYGSFCKSRTLPFRELSFYTILISPTLLTRGRTVDRAEALANATRNAGYGNSFVCLDAFE